MGKKNVSRAVLTVALAASAVIIISLLLFWTSRLREKRKVEELRLELEKVIRTGGEEALLSLAGVYKTGNKQDIPLALRTYLERHTGTKAVYLHLDNDEVGRMATKQITEALSSQYTVIDQPPQSGKDFNDYLKNEIQKEKRKEQVR